MNRIYYERLYLATVTHRNFIAHPPFDCDFGCFPVETPEVKPLMHRRLCLEHNTIACCKLLRKPAQRKLAPFRRRPGHVIPCFSSGRTDALCHENPTRGKRRFYLKVSLTAYRRAGTQASTAMDFFQLKTRCSFSDTRKGNG